MRYTLTTHQIREILTMVSQQLYSLVLILLSQQGTIGFFLAPKVKEIHRIYNDSRLFATKPSGYKDFSSSFESDEKTENEEDSFLIQDNDLRSVMFLLQDDESNQDEQYHGGGFDVLEFFMTQDESNQRLEKVENCFREKPDGSMMISDQEFIRQKHIANTNTPSVAIRSE